MAMDLGAWLTPERTFSVSNPDYSVYTETLTVESYAAPAVVLRSDRWNVVDIAGIPYTSTSLVEGRVVWATDSRVVVRVSGSGCEVGVQLSAQGATWLLDGADLAVPTGATRVS